MNWKAFWGIFTLTQFVGAIGVMTGSPHGNPLGLLFALVFLFPGSVLCWPVLDKLGIQTTGGPVLVTSFLVNVVCWSAFVLIIGRVRSKKAT